MAAAVWSCVAQMPTCCLSGIFLESAEQDYEENRSYSVTLSPGICPQPSDADLESAVLPELKNSALHPHHGVQHLYEESFRDSCRDSCRQVYFQQLSCSGEILGGKIRQRELSQNLSRIM